MRSKPNIPQATKLNQALAADPRASAWVAANAGSGKTHVLVNRVLRLLLAEVAPGRMLCITYTRAAAANMANRVFAALSAWATLPDAALAAELAALTGQTPPAEGLAAARRLFAQALETPGGLRIETIHAFCTRVLQAAPFEANVPPRFEVADDLAQAEMLREARQELLAEIAAEPGGEAARALGLLARLAAQDTFDAMMQEALRQRALFAEPEGPARDAAAMRRDLSAFLGIAPDLAVEEVRRGFAREVAALPGLAALVDALAAGGKTRARVAENLRLLLSGRQPGCPVALCRDGFLTEAGTINLHVRGKGRSEFEPGLLAVLESLADLVLAAQDRLAAIAIRDRSHALAVLVTAMLARYRRLKSRRSLLDYDDLIAKTRSLFARVEAAWVLYKLDAGIDHILLDEAQDTSEAQWAILGSLTAEFFAGHGAREEAGRPRTVFVVGDEKQSIYGFQGAAPAAFGDERRRLGRQLREVGRRFETVSLNTSFRSTAEVMDLVDAVFALPDHARGLVFDGAARPQTHATVREHDPGCVDLWPLSLDDAGEPPDAWTAPVDAVARRSGVAKLAGRIARTLGRWTRAGHDDLGHPFAPGDVMILLRNRGALFEAVVKALKDEGVPVAGRDRLLLAEHPAVEDLVVLGRALLLPEDDLALATALKTPLIGLDDDDLMRLAPGRPGSLRAALREAAQGEPRYAGVEARLAELGREAARCGPFRFFATLLGPGGARNLALGRLGSEAGDALDAFLGAALDHERRHGPSLAGFLQHLGAAAGEVKRDLSASAGEVRVMTVHGAKGLEARIVLLADLGVRPNGRRLPKIMAVEPPRAGPVPIWPPAAAEDCRATADAKRRVLEQLVEEHHRLLYVALTRAEDRLIVCAAHGEPQAPAGSWYAMVAAGLDAGLPGTAEVEAPDGEGLVRRFGTRLPAPAGPHPARPEGRSDRLLPPWLARPAPREAEPLPPLRPSSALAAADAAERPADGPFLAEAAAAGRLAHLLLQVLPEVEPPRRQAAAQALAQLRGAALAPERRSRIVTEVLALLAAPDLAALFAEGSLAEVPLAGTVTLPDGRAHPVAGRIDRLAVTPREVVLVDFKTAARPPGDAAAIPPETLAQIAIYRALLAAMYPGRTVHALLVYTATLARLEPSTESLDGALAPLG